MNWDGRLAKVGPPATVGFVPPNVVVIHFFFFRPALSWNCPIGNSFSKTARGGILNVEMRSLRAPVRPEGEVIGSLVMVLRGSLNGLGVLVWIYVLNTRIGQGTATVQIPRTTTTKPQKTFLAS